MLAICRRPIAIHALPSFSRLLSSVPQSCPTCGTPYVTYLPTCTKCSTIKPLRPDTPYHTLFGLPPNTFDIDTRALRGEFLRLQRVCHPDAWGTRGEEEKQLAEEQSSLLNQAYRTLQLPLSRAQYLLALNGHSSLETDSLDEGDADLLMEILEGREALEEASSPEELESLREENQQKIDATMKELSAAFKNLNWVKAKEITVRLRYWQNIEDVIREKLR